MLGCAASYIARLVMWDVDGEFWFRSYPDGAVTSSPVYAASGSLWPGRDLAMQLARPAMRAEMAMRERRVDPDGREARFFDAAWQQVRADARAGITEAGYGVGADVVRFYDHAEGTVITITVTPADVGP